VEAIFNTLKEDSSQWAKEVLEDLSKASPLSLKVTFELLKRGRTQNLPECLKIEYRVSQNLLQYDDFFNGVSARLINKTNNPSWNPKSLEEVTETMVNSMFDPIKGGRDLDL